MKTPNEKILKYNNMRFDCIVSNAPYNNGLHEKFESKYFDICKGEIVWVSPLSFLLGKKQNKRITLELDKYKTDIEQINGNEYFDAAIGGTMGIVFCDMADEHNEHYVKFDGKQYSKCDEISTISNDSLLMNIKTKINCENLLDNIHVHIVKQPNTNKFASCKIEQNPQDNWWCVRMTPFAGDNHRGSKGADFYATVTKKYINELPITYKDAQSKTYKFNNGVIKNYMDYYIHFNTYSEAKHCLDYLISDFARICIYFIKTTIELSSGELKYVPWQDFTQEWNDEKLFKKYGITKEEIQNIYDILPNYYNIERIDLDTYKLNSITFDGKQYNKCDEISYQSESSDPILIKFGKKVNCKFLTDNLYEHLHTNEYAIHTYDKLVTNPDENAWVVGIIRLHAPLKKDGSHGDSWTAMISKNKLDDYIGQYKDVIKRIRKTKTGGIVPILQYYFSFKSKKEAYNFRYYIQTTFVQACLTLIKQNANFIDSKEIAYVPWQDFTQEWNDEKLFKKYGITKEEIQHIYEILPNYYGIERINLDTYEL